MFRNSFEDEFWAALVPDSPRYSMVFQQNTSLDVCVIDNCLLKCTGLVVVYCKKSVEWKGKYIFKYLYDAFICLLLNNFQHLCSNSVLLNIPADFLFLLIQYNLNVLREGLKEICSVWDLVQYKSIIYRNLLLE